MIYDNPYFALYRLVIYRWRALELYLMILKTGGTPLLGVRPYWGIYSIISRSSDTQTESNAYEPNVHSTRAVNWDSQVQPGPASLSPLRRTRHSTVRSLISRIFTPLGAIEHVSQVLILITCEDVHKIVLTACHHCLMIC